MHKELKLLEESIEQIAQVAKGFGLDFYPVRFEICPADIIYTFGAYGMPTRFSHWSFGKAFYKMKIQYDFNLSRIYELVINSDPCYAFLLEGNSLVQNKLVIAHVFAHCDFFKNNATFRRTNRGMVDSMAVSADRVRKMEFDHGRAEVEKILDAVIAIQEHVDPRYDIARENKSAAGKDKGSDTTVKPDPYEDLLALDRPQTMGEKRPEEKPKPQKDLLKYIMEKSKYLKDWQREIVAIIREEMLYFYPQMETKIMNEGWASYWHARILRELDLTPEEAMDFAVMHSSVIQPSRMSINPYFLGYKIWESVEKRWNEPGKQDREELGLKGGEGRAKMMEIREMENDVSFIRNYLTRELIEELDLFTFQKIGNTWQVTEKDWRQVRDTLSASLFNCGYPYIMVEEGDYNKNGELLLRHYHEGVDLDLHYLERTLPHVYTLWGRGVNLATIMDGKPVTYSYSGDRVIKTLR